MVWSTLHSKLKTSFVSSLTYISEPLPKARAKRVLKLEMFFLEHESGLQILASLNECTISGANKQKRQH